MKAASSGRNPTRRRWAPAEDDALRRLVQIHGGSNWTLISSGIPGRTADSCRARWWRSHLPPAAEDRPSTEAEDKIIARAHPRFGSNSGRTDDAIMNGWNAAVKNRLSSFSGGDCGRSPTTTNPSASIGIDFLNSIPHPPSAIGSSSSASATESGEDDPMTRLTLASPGYRSDRHEVCSKMAAAAAAAPMEVIPLGDGTASSNAGCGFGAEWQAMKEMIRREVRSYLAELGLQMRASHVPMQRI